MIRPLLLMAAAFALSACAGRGDGMIHAAPLAGTRPPVGPDATPLRGDPPPFPPEDHALSRIAVGCCVDQKRPLPVLAAVALTKPDLFVLAGDGVRGEATAGNMKLPELRQAYEDLTFHPEFSAFNMAVPMVATWGGRDYGAQGAGAEFPGRAVSETLFETFWREAALGPDRPGVQGARVFGPAGRRVQTVLLDGRSFRAGSEVLGEDQRRWLAEQLTIPAEVRLIVVGGPESAGLEAVLREAGAKGVILVAGTGAGGLSRTAAGPGYGPARMSTPSLNLDAAAGFGLVEIDWARRAVTLSIRGVDGAVRSAATLTFSDLGTP